LKPADDVSIGPNSFNEIWLLVDVPADARPGVYEATDLLSVPGVRLQVTVRDFALPHKPSLPVSVGLALNPMEHYRLYSTEASPEDCWPLAVELLRHRVVPREMLADLTDWRTDPPDFTLADEILDRAETGGYNARAFVAARAKHLDEMRQPARSMRRALAHWRARTGEDVTPMVIPWTGGVPSSLGRAQLKRSIACWSSTGRAPRYADLAGIWALPYDLFGNTFMLLANEQRVRMWEEVGASDQDVAWHFDTVQSPSMHDWMEWRLLGCLVYDHGVGMLTLGETLGPNLHVVPHYWVASRMLTAFPSREGQGELEWSSVHPEIKLEALRDGLEDYEYLHMLSQLQRRLRNIGGAQKHTRLYRENSWLLKLDYRIIKNVRSYTHDPDVVMQWREALARQIERTRDVLRRHGEEGLPGD